MHRFKNNKIIIVISLVFIIFISNTMLNKYYYSKFTPSKWLNNESKRVLMVDDMLENYKIKKMNKTDILDLLGKPTIIEKMNNNIMYYLGDERSFVSVDSELLVVYFNEKDECIKYEIITD